MKSIKITDAEEKWLREALAADIVALEEWEPDLDKAEKKELAMLRKFVAELDERITECAE